MLGKQVNVLSVPPMNSRTSSEYGLLPPISTNSFSVAGSTSLSLLLVRLVVAHCLVPRLNQLNTVGPTNGDAESSPSGPTSSTEEDLNR